MVVNPHRTDANRCAGEEQVARLQREEAADVRHYLVHPEEHVARTAFLHGAPVDVEMEVERLNVAELVHANPLADGCRAVKAFAKVP